MRSVSVSTSSKNQFVDITREVSGFASQEQIEEGLIVVYVPHTTAGVTINEGADPLVVKDVQAQLAKVAPPDAPYSHSEGNSDGHIKTTVVGSSVVIPVSGRKLALGTWQAIFFCEFDGPRQRKYYLAAAK